MPWTADEMFEALRGVDAAMCERPIRMSNLFQSEMAEVDLSVRSLCREREEMWAEARWTAAIRKLVKKFSSSAKN